MRTEVLVYPEKKWEKFGAERYEVSWEEVAKHAKGKDEIDPDTDIDYLVAHTTAYEDAVELAKRILRRRETAYGAASVQKQRVDWFVEEQRIAEWADVGESEEFCTGDVEAA